MGLMMVLLLGFFIWLYSQGPGFSGSTSTAISQTAQEIIVNDVHSQLNATPVGEIVKPISIESLQGAIINAKVRGQAVSISGGRHAMGGQQFGTHAMLIDMRAMNQVLRFDQKRGLIEVQAGIEWT